MKAFYAGSFNPFTIGHYSVARRAMNMFPYLFIGVGINESKNHIAHTEENIVRIEKLFEKDTNVKVMAYTGLTARVALEQGAGVLIRGVRNAFDFEKEKELADINLKIFGMPTIFIPADPDLAFISSSMVRELSHFGFDVERFLPSK